MASFKVTRILEGTVKLASATLDSQTPMTHCLCYSPLRREGGDHHTDPAHPTQVPQPRSGLIHGVEEDPEGVKGLDREQPSRAGGSGVG